MSAKRQLTILVILSFLLSVSYGGFALGGTSQVLLADNIALKQESTRSLEPFHLPQAANERIAVDVLLGLKQFG